MGLRAAGRVVATVIVCVPVGALPPPCRGQCRAPAVFTAPYAAPVYHAPVVVEKVVVKEVLFAVPTPFALFQFTSPPTTPPPVLVAAPPAAPAPAAPAHAPAAAPPAAAPAPCAAVEARLARLEAALRQAPAADAPPVALGEALASSPEAYTSAAPASPAPRVRTDYPGALGPAVAALAARGCAQCHTGSAARGDVTLWNDRGEFQPSVGWEDILASVKSRRGKDGSVRPAKMPRGQPVKMSEAEVALVRRMRDSEGE